MKKTLIALAAVAVAGAASAQMTMSGSVGFALQTNHGDSKNSLDMTSADINFSANEDLGGGMNIAAGTSISLDDRRGQPASANNTTLTLSGGFGKLSTWSVLSGSAKLSGGESLEQDMSDYMGGYTGWSGITYSLPTLIEGVGVDIEWAAETTTWPAGVFTAAARPELTGAPYVYVNYNGGPVWAHVEFQSDDLSNSWDLRGSYDLGVAKLSGRYTQAKAQEFAITAPVGAVTAGLHYGKTDADNTGTAFSATYALSKRTNVNASYATGKEAGVSGNNYRLGLNHSF